MSSQPNKSLIDGLACLQSLASARHPLGCRELARELGLNHMRANRLLKTLAEIGLARQDAKKKYAIGPGIHALTAQSIFGSSILKQALPLITQINHPGLTVALGVFWRGYVTYLFHGVIGEGLESGIGRIGLVPYYNSSIGMLLLANESDSEIEALRAKNSSGMTKRELFSEVKAIRKQGYSVRSGETNRGLAVPVGNPSVAGLALSGIPVECDIEEYVVELTTISEQIAI